jgi:hypothetical protein
MSTPEFFLFRKVAESDDELARRYVCEMLSRTVTSLTKSALEDGEFEVIDEPRTSVAALMWYCEPVMELPESHRLADIVFDVLSTGGIGEYEREVAETFEIS